MVKRYNVKVHPRGGTQREYSEFGEHVSYFDHKDLQASHARLLEALNLIATQGPSYGPDGTWKTWRHWSEIAKDAIAAAQPFTENTND